jgi:hypothetical protein
MSNRWTPERKARQAELIKAWQPWKQSTGAKTPEGKAAVSRNAFKGGHRPILRQVIRTCNDQIEQVRKELEKDTGHDHPRQADRQAIHRLACDLVINRYPIDTMLDDLLTPNLPIK